VGRGGKGGGRWNEGRTEGRCREWRGREEWVGAPFVKS